jgi:hypothetical protein
MAFFVKLLRWAILFVTIYWILIISLRHNSYRKAERDWLRRSMEGYTTSRAEPISNEKTPEHLTFYKTLPQKVTEP